MTIRDFESLLHRAKMEIIHSYHGPKTMEDILDTEISIETNHDVFDVNSVGNQFRSCGCADSVIIFVEKLS